MSIDLEELRKELKEISNQHPWIVERVVDEDGWLTWQVRAGQEIVCTTASGARGGFIAKAPGRLLALVEAIDDANFTGS